MARTAVAVVTLQGGVTGVAPMVEVACDPAVAPDGNVVVSYSDHMWLEFTCTVAGPVNITFVTPGNVAGRAIADDIYAISGIGTKRRFGPFDKDVYGPDLQFNAPATVTVAAYQSIVP